MRTIPAELLTVPFTRAYALELGVTPRMLECGRFVRIHPQVYRVRDLSMSRTLIVEAARLALPAGAYLTSISRLQVLGLDFGPQEPVHFVIASDLHLTIDGIVLHRTAKLPPLDGVGVGVSIEAAYLAYCATARIIDAIKVGDWLLHHGHMDMEALVALAEAERWRAGADEVLWIVGYLDPESRSLMESETRGILVFAGLPRPSSNAPLALRRSRDAIGDLWYARWKVLVEYEGTQHQENRAQYLTDIKRYADLRDDDVRYVQVTKELIREPRAVVIAVYRELLRNGYDGAPPVFGDTWSLLFSPVRDAVGPRPVRCRST